MNYHQSDLVTAAKCRKIVCPKCSGGNAWVESERDVLALRHSCGLIQYMTADAIIYLAEDQKLQAVPERVPVVEEKVFYLTPVTPQEVEPEAEDKDPTLCALDECLSSRTDRSKYCSRACSNTNARRRYEKKRRSK